MNKNPLSTSSLPHIIALMYHRINNVDTDPWGICVSPQHFEAQIRFLKNHFPIITAVEAIRQAAAGNIMENSICLTFDDGYADNYLHAKTILEQHHCPATFFIATAFSTAAKPFWWDELEMIFLHSKQLPEHLSLYISGEPKYYTFPGHELTQDQWHQHKNWRWHEPPPTDRCAAFLNIWEQLRPLPDEEIKKQLAYIKEWSGNISASAHRLPMNEDQLSQLSKSSLFTIGMHTHTHPDLAEKGKQFQAEEMKLCKHILKTKYGIDSHCLSYPYGRYNVATLDVIPESDIIGCFTTEETLITGNSHVAKLGRYQVCDWDANHFAKQLAGWNNDLT